ncbi:hypothetical protein ABTD73_19710, partial [Acinetobacter baumannii]
LGIFQRRWQHIIEREALKISLGYIGLAMLFAIGIFYKRGQEAGFQFLTGYFIDMSLSVDNLFVFFVIFRHFSVPAMLQRRILIFGIIG